MVFSSEKVKLFLEMNFSEITGVNFAAGVSSQLTPLLQKCHRDHLKSTLIIKLDRDFILIMRQNLNC